MSDRRETIGLIAAGYRDASRRGCRPTMTIACVCCFSWIAVASTGASLPAPALCQAGKNLALGRTARFSFAPNYSYSAGGDEKDLFDGKYVTDGFWTNKGTVGWQFGRKPGVLISVDLGKVSAIDALSFDTAAGSAQVTFPAAVFVFVSDDGDQWHYVTDLINEPISQAEYVRHRFVAKGLETRGRHVALYVAQGGFFAFVDEIEVIEGNHDAGAVKFAAPSIATDQLESNAAERAQQSVQKNITLYLIQAARDAVDSAAPSAEKASERLDLLQQAAINSPFTDEADYSRGIPFRQLDREVCQTMGGHFAAGGRDAVELWQPAVSFWDHTTSPFARTDVIQVPKLHADMMIGEYEPVALNISNNTTRPLTIQVQLDDLKSAKGISWPSGKVEPKVSRHVIAAGYQFFDDALPTLTNSSFTVAPGMTRQLWLILHSRGIVPGSYRSRVRLQSSGEAYEIPITATVYDVHMPTNPDYTAQSWGYFTWPAAKGFERLAAAELRRCYANAHVLHHYYIPWPKVDERSRKLVRPVELDTTRLDEMLGYRPYVKQWLLWPGFEFGYMTLNYHQASDAPKVGTVEHEKFFKEWVEAVRNHLESKGLDNERWAFYWVDEPGDEKFKRLVVPASRMAKQVDRSIVIWEDHQTSLELLEQYPDAIDIHCCPLDYYLSHPDVLKHVRGEKRPGVHYLASGSKAGDPHRFYRLHHMAAVELGLDGAGLWVWSDDGGQFSDYLSSQSYGMVYASKSGPVTGKRREAWREGIEDVELWRHLREAADRRNDDDLLKLYRDSPARLTKRVGATHLGTVDELMKTRLRILRALASN